MPSLHRAVPVKFFHFVPAKSSEAKFAQPQGPRSCPGACAAWPSKSCWSSATSASAISVFTRLFRQIREARVADHVARVARDHEAAGIPLVRGQGQLRGEALRLTKGVGR